MLKSYNYPVGDLLLVRDYLVRDSGTLIFTASSMAKMLSYSATNSVGDSCACCVLLWSSLIKLFL